MKLSYNWLKEYVNIDVTPENLSEILTDTGLEVEGLEKFQSIKGGLEGIVIGEVKECGKHPEADRLSITKVDVGEDQDLQIVCGAPNVAQGQKVLVATVGTTLYADDGSFKIKKSKLRGELSQGMICAEDELGLGDSHDGIMILDASAKTGMKASEYFDIKEDYIYEIGLTPNRCDATGHIGSARDLVAFFNCQDKKINRSLSLPSVDKFKKDNDNLNDIEISIENKEACNRYSGVCIDNITVTDSPEWLKNRLESVGMRSINNVVDVTNYILMTTGQPLHAFDYDQITGNKITVKKLAKDTPFVCLDDLERKLDDTDLMICNQDEGMCIAGVFGGQKSGVTEKTTRIFIESANFDPVHVRKTSKRHNFNTDASFRFERGADVNITIYAAKLAALLLKDISDATIASDIKDIYPNKIEAADVRLNYSKLNTLCGLEIDREIVKIILTSLDIVIKEENDLYLDLEIPTNKCDVTREVDVIEEVLRIYGYNNIPFPEQMRSSATVRVMPDKEMIKNTISEMLTSNGFNEIMNNSLTNSVYSEKLEGINAEENAVVFNPLSQELNVKRQTMLIGGMENISDNQKHRNFDLKFYEFGNVYKFNPNEPQDQDVRKRYPFESKFSLLVTGNQSTENWDIATNKTNFFVIKQYVELIFSRLNIDISKLKINEEVAEYFSFGLSYATHDKQICQFGKLNSKTNKIFDVKGDVFYADFNWENIITLYSKSAIKFKEIAKFPKSRRDLALVIDKNIKFADIKAIALKTERNILEDIGLFDVYEGDKIDSNKKSYAISLTFSDKEKTLTDKIIDKTIKKILYNLEREFGANLR